MVKYFKSIVSGLTEHHFYLAELDDSINYAELCHILNTTTDSVHIHINSRGGSLQATVQILKAIESCKGSVYGYLEGLCHSAATLIFLSCDYFIVADNCSFMIHNYSGGAFGKGGEIYSQALHTNKWVYDLMRDVYTPFLTDEEIHSVKLNQDIWLFSPDVIERLDSRVIPHRQNLANKAIEDGERKLLIELAAKHKDYLISISKVLEECQVSEEVQPKN